MNLQFVECDNDAAWDEFVENSPQGSIFCLSSFLTTLEKTVHRWFVYQSGSVVAAYPVLLENGNPIVAPHAFTLYQGLMFEREIDSLPYHSGVPQKLKIAEFLVTNLAEKYSLISFCSHPHLTDMRAFTWFNYHSRDAGVFEINTMYTARLDLRDFKRDLFINQVRNLRKREIVKAQNAGFKVIITSDIKTLDQLHDMTFQRQSLKRSEDDTTLFYKICQRALADGFGHCMQAINESGEVAASNLIIKDRNAAFYLIGANHPEFRSSGASTLLMFEAISKAAEDGASVFDFVGINSPNRGDYKISFNAEPVAYHIATWKRPLL